MKINREEQFCVEMLKEQLTEQAKYIDEVRSVKHDMQAHLIALYHYLQADEFHRAKEYLAKVMSIPLFCGTSAVEVGHNLINNIIFFSLYRSKANIELQTSGLLPEDLKIEDIDLCVLFSNLISNSVEACEKLEHTDKVIALEIQEVGKNLVITLQNPIEWEINPEEFGKGSSKEDKLHHGYGLRNLGLIVDKYNGDLEFELSESLVLVKVTFRDIVSSIPIC